MCIFSVIYRVVPGCPLFVLTNRDESIERPTTLPRVSTSGDNGTRWFGGADARAGGTWFGINEHGLLAAVTNRKQDPLPPNPRSRGLLCRDVLGHATAASAVDWVVQELAANPYAGFNLLVLTTGSAWIVEAADAVLVTEIRPGIHSVSNGPYRAHDDPRVNLAQSLVTQMVREEADWQSYVDRAQQICSLPASDGNAGMCLHKDGWGTVGSTIAALANDRRQSQYHYAAGPPCRTAFVDYSDAFRGMISRSN